MTATTTHSTIKIIRFDMEPDSLALAEPKVNHLPGQSWRVITAGGDYGGLDSLITLFWKSSNWS